MHWPAGRIDIQLVHPGLRHARRRPLRRTAHHQVGRYLHRHAAQHRIRRGIGIDVEAIDRKDLHLGVAEGLGDRRIDHGLAARQIQLLRRRADDQRHLDLLSGGENGFRRPWQDAAVDHGLEPDEAGVGDRHRQSVGRGLKLARRYGAQVGKRAGARRVARRILSGQFDAHGFVLLEAARRQAELRRPAFLDGAREQAGGQGRRQQKTDVLGAGAVAHHRDIARIAAERGDVGAHPLKRLDLVHQGVIARCAVAFGGQGRMRQEAEYAEAILDRDDDHALRREARHDRPGRAAGAIGAAMDEDDNRPVRCRGERRRAHFEIQTILATGPGQIGIPAVGDLGAGRRAGPGWTHVRPGFGILRRRPAQVTDRRTGEGDAAKGEGTVGKRLAGNLTASDRYGLRARHKRGRKHQECQ